MIQYHYGVSTQRNLECANPIGKLGGLARFVLDLVQWSRFFPTGTSPKPHIITNHLEMLDLDFY